MPAKAKVKVGDETERSAAEKILAAAKASRSDLKAIAATTGNLSNAAQSDALRLMATAIVRIERAIALITKPQTDDFS